MDSPLIERHQTYDELSNVAVFRCRIGVHTLGPQDDEKSENHLTLYLLVGSDRCVRVDMVPSSRTPYSDLIGRLVLRGHDYTLSTGVVRYADVDARGCPSNFDPSAEYARPQGSRTVGQLVLILIQHRLHMFRFTDLDGKSLGCRSWIVRVMFMFQQAGYLQPHTNLQQISQLVQHQWDRSLRPRTIVPVPGLFLGRYHEDLNHDTLVERISGADPSALRILGHALAAQNRDAMNVLEQSKSTSPSVRNTAFGRLGTMANRRNREASAARDFTAAPVPTLEALANAINGRYRLGRGAIQSANRARESNSARMSTVFTLYLAAVCDMSGPPDDEDDEDDENDNE